MFLKICVMTRQIKVWNFKYIAVTNPYWHLRDMAHVCWPLWYYESDLIDAIVTEEKLIVGASKLVECSIKW